MRRALLDLKTAQYDQCLAKLDQILSQDPHNAQAHYLKAVVYVMTRHYSQAAAEYRETLKNNPGPDLGERARSGLAKLNR